MWKNGFDASLKECQTVSASQMKPGSPDGPDWLDQVLGCSSPPFSFRNGGSAVTNGKKRAQQDAAIPPACAPARTNGNQRK
jgi:hypothetical protein